jgi:hypothetical protein
LSLSRRFSIDSVVAIIGSGEGASRRWCM